MNFEINKSLAGYLELMIHQFYNDLLTLLDKNDLSDEDLEKIYALGYNYFTYGKYSDAKNIFILLTGYAPDTAHYWRALGAVNQQMRDYDKAIESYEMAIANDESDVVSFVYRGESQILSGKIEGAIKDFKQVLIIGENYPGFEAWVTRSKLLLQIHKQ